jgi:hypothetical protein
MKRNLLTSFQKKGLLAVPAAALMLGAAQAGTTIGLNFQAWYYDSGATPQTVGFGTGYQTTGFPVTAKAFGIAPANWFNTDPLDCSTAISTSVPFGGTLTAQITAPNAWMSGIGELNAGFNAPSPGIAETVAPGNDEATWGYLDDGNATGKSPSVSVAGLAAKFPNGYVIQTIAANGGAKNYDGVDFTDGVTTNAVAYSTYFKANNPAVNADVSGGTVGLSAQSASFTSDTININCHPKTASNRSTLAGFILTDQPVVTKDPTNTSLNLGGTLILSAGSIGLTSALFYQWRENGANLPGANSAVYTKAGATSADAGNYDLVVTNLYGAATSGVASVTVIAVPTITRDLTGATGTVYSGANFSQWSVAASGGLPLHYYWHKNGTTSVGADSPTLMLSNVAVGDAGNYSVTVSNNFNVARSATNHLIVVASPNLYTTDVAQDSPGAYWSLNESSGTVATDYSGLGNNGTNIGGLSLGVNGPRPPSYVGFDAGKTAYQFDGASAYVDCGTGPSLSGTTDFTLEAWINTTTAADGTIIQQRSPTGFNGEYAFNVTASGALHFMIYGGGYQFDFSTSRTVNDGLWHHVAAMRSGVNGTIYIDGTPAANASGTVAPLDPTIATYIGSDHRDSLSYFTGMISDVAIYPVALSNHGITLHAYNGRLGNAPFSLSIVPGGYVTDSKPAGIPHPGVNNNATWTNAVTDVAATPVTRNGVEVFAGNSQITIPADTDFNSPQGTIMFWLQANAPIPGPGNGGAILFDRRTTNGVVMVLNDDGSIFWQGQGGNANTFSGGYVPDNNWHHIAVTYGQAINDTLSIYVDGLLASSVLVTNGWSWPTAQEIEIGRSHDSFWKKLNGQLDDFRIYNRVLTAVEVASVQSNDALVDTAALKVRYNFDNSGVGKSLTWPVGSLQSSPTLGPSSVWTPILNATPPYPFLPPSPSTPRGTSLFYRAGF